jgi:hypothetical protein
MKLLARWLSHAFRFLTGIEIHPGATDRPQVLHRSRHGRGDRRDRRSRRERHPVSRRDAGRHDPEKGKRHPTLEDNVVVGAGAKILGASSWGPAAASAPMLWWSRRCRRTRWWWACPGRWWCAASRAPDEAPRPQPQYSARYHRRDRLALMQRLDKLEAVLEGRRRSPAMWQHPQAGKAGDEGCTATWIRARQRAQPCQHILKHGKNGFERT